MLEAEAVLRTWALEQLPRGWDAARSRTAARYGACAATSAATTVVARRLTDHRIGYLEEEGPLSGGRGEVLRIDAGTYQTVTRDSQSWQVVLSGQVVRGQVTLGLSTLSID